MGRGNAQLYRQERIGNVGAFAHHSDASNHVFNGYVGTRHYRGFDSVRGAGVRTFRLWRESGMSAISLIVLCLAIFGTGIGLAVSLWIRGENQGRAITMLITLGDAALGGVWQTLVVLLAFGLVGLLVVLLRFPHFLRPAAN